MSKGKTYIIANWKMHGSIQLFDTFLTEFIKKHNSQSSDVIICPPCGYLSHVGQILSPTPISLGAQNISEYSSGAYTGEVSAIMLKDLGCSHVIIGHSERRTLFAETDASIAQKLHQALKAQLVPILCVGESLEDYEENKRESVIIHQLRRSLSQVDTSTVESDIMIAYEPIWAIGTGRTATPDDISLILKCLTEELQHTSTFKLLYGGSVKASNISDILAIPHLDGVLVGGASMNINDFLTICA